MAQYFAGLFSQTLPEACIIVNTPPTFSGISGLVANLNGSLTVSWSAASGVAVNPVRYNVYIAEGIVIPSFLFDDANLLPLSASQTSVDVYTDATGTTLTPGQTYTVGVRAIDAVGNEDNNTVTDSEVVTYNLYSLLAATPGLVWDVSKSGHTTSNTFGESNQGIVSVSRANNLDNLDASVASRSTQVSVNAIPTNPLLTSDTRLNSLSNLDATVSSRATQSSVNSIPTNPALTTDPRFANLDATISSRATETDLLAVKAQTDQFSFTGGDVNAYSVNIDQRTHSIFAISGTNMLTGHLWLTNGGQVVTTGLGTATYQVYDNDDNAIPGLGESGLTANGNGVYLITPVSAVALDPFTNYRVKISIVQNLQTITSFRGFTVGE